MDDLQYSIAFLTSAKFLGLSFKPCYKWMTFNTVYDYFKSFNKLEVLNLVING